MNPDKDMEVAATTIQGHFRQKQARKQAKRERDAQKKAKQEEKVKK